MAFVVRNRCVNADDIYSMYGTNRTCNFKAIIKAESSQLKETGRNSSTSTAWSRSWVLTPS